MHIVACKLLIVSSCSLHIIRMISLTRFHAIHKLVGQEMHRIGILSESSWTLRYAYCSISVCAFNVDEMRDGM